MAPAPRHSWRLFITMMTLALLGAVLISGLYYLVTKPAPVAPVGTVETQISVGSGPSTGAVSPAFFGINLRVQYAASSAPGNLLSTTPINYYRWPGGDVAERFDAVNNVLYTDSGKASPAPTSLEATVRWCQATNCELILQLPTEINDVAYVSTEVLDVVQSLHFEPAYWELGNEPASWTHFNISWSAWNSTQAINVTPVRFAEVVTEYEGAIHTADPNARILGMAGVGNGGSGEAAWLYNVARADGKNLSGYSLHVYPAGVLTDNLGGLPAFYGTLEGGGAIPIRVLHDRAAIIAGCPPPSCPTPTILVTELGSGTGNGPYASQMSGFEEVPFIAAELIQGLWSNVSNADLFAYQSAYDGSFVNPSNGAVRPVQSLYDTFLPQLPSQLLNSTADPAVPGLFQGAFIDPTGSRLSLWVVNTASTNVRLHWTIPGSAAGAVPTMTTTWFPGSLTPTKGLGDLAGPITVTLPPEGMVLWQVAGSLVPASAIVLPQGPVRPSVGPASLGGISAQALLTATSVSVPLMPGIRRMRVTTISSASLTWAAWIFTIMSKGPVTASTSTTWGTWRTRFRTSSSRPTSVSTSR
jgi:hypothetical protein